MTQAQLARDVGPGLGYRPTRAFDHGLPDVPVHAFVGELETVSSPTAVTGLVPLDLSEALGLPYPATTPLFLARYAVLRPGVELEHEFRAAVEFHYVLAGEGSSTNGGRERVRWSAGDAFCFPGGGATVHRAGSQALIITVTDEPEWAYRAMDPPRGGLVEPAVFRVEEINAELGLVHATGSPQLTAGKSVSFTTARMNARISGALAPNMMAAVNTLEAAGCSGATATTRSLSRSPWTRRPRIQSSDQTRWCGATAS